MAIINGSNSTLYSDRDYITSYYFNTSGSDTINLFAGDDYAMAGLGADTMYGGDPRHTSYRRPGRPWHNHHRQRD